MNIVQITPGAGGMYCGGCFRDNALVAALRKLGHTTTMIPLYLPLTLDEPDQSDGTPIFFSGINVFLEQKIPLFSKAPRWLHRLLASPRLLKLAAGSAAKTRAADVGELTLSMLRGEEGRQARELTELINWLKTTEPADIICLSNALLLGLARQLKQELRVPVVCMLQGEDSFLDALPVRMRAEAWITIAERARNADLFIAPSHYFADQMRSRLGLPADQVKVVYNGINLDDYKFTDVSSSPTGEGTAARNHAVALGYFARICREKGAELIVKTYIALRQKGRVPNVKLRIGGGLSPADESFVEKLRQRLKEHGYEQDVSFHPNLDRSAKLDFLKSLTVLCTPALYGEAFGLYVIEAMAAGVPVVQPRHAAFPELIEATGGGVIAEPNAPALAEAIEGLLLDPVRARALAQAGRAAVMEDFSIDQMAGTVVQVFRDLLGARQISDYPVKT